MVNLESGTYSIPHQWLTNDISIALVGVGATGSAVASLLYKLNHIRREITDGDYGVEVALFDPKSVTETGKNRTGFLASEVGKNKAFCMANKLNNSYGKKFCIGVDQPFSFDVYRNAPDMVITATDSAKSRNAIFKNGIHHAKTLWLDIGVGGSSGNVILGELGKGKCRLPTVCDLFNTLQAEEDDKTLERNSCDTLDAITRQSFTVNEMGGAIGIGLLSQLIFRGSISSHGALYNVKSMQSTPLTINRTVWRSFGFNYRKSKTRVANSH